LRLAGVEEFRDSEAEELGRSVFKDKNVRRLEIAMNDEVLVCVPNGRADLEHKFDALTR
jgi:hypothetical protein